MAIRKHWLWWRAWPGLWVLFGSLATPLITIVR
jgi:hypothetical protein